MAGGRHQVDRHQDVLPKFGNDCKASDFRDAVLPDEGLHIQTFLLIDGLQPVGGVEIEGRIVKNADHADGALVVVGQKPGNVLVRQILDRKHLFLIGHPVLFDAIGFLEDPHGLGAVGVALKADDPDFL